jgi:Alpha-L-fucosidase
MFLYFKDFHHIRMKAISFTFSLWISLLFTTIDLNGQERYQANWESLKKYQVPDWFRDAKFGIFIHWGVYSVPGFANEWYPRNMYQQGSKEYNHHVEMYGSISTFGYKDFIPQFKAELFDPVKWVDNLRFRLLFTDRQVYQKGNS